MNSSLVREVKMKNIDKIIPDCIQKIKPVTANEHMENFDKVEAQGVAGNSLAYLNQLHQMYLREINIGLPTDQALFAKIKDSLNSHSKNESCH